MQLARKAAQRAAPDAEKQKKRLKTGKMALFDIRKFQNSSDLVLKNAPFVHFVGEISQNMGLEHLRWKPYAIARPQKRSIRCWYACFVTHDVARYTLNESSATRRMLR